MSSGKVLIVTGASSGIGRCLAEQAVHAGYNVVAVGRRAQRLDELEARLGITAASLRTLVLDVRQTDAAKAITGKALDTFGRIDVIVNNAGIGAVGTLRQQTDAGLREQFETHVLAPIALVREAHEALRKTKGQVFFMGSGVARVPITGFGAYPAAKAAIRSIARIARQELKHDGIAVTYVDPGAVASEFHTRLGYAGPPASIATTPEHVAKRILKAVKTRPRDVNAVPWQTFLVSLAEFAPLLTDMILERIPSILGSKPLHPAALDTQESQPALPPPIAHEKKEQTSLSQTLAPYERRMKKMNLSHELMSTLLLPSVVETADEIALRWAGMPNKNERALMHDILEALAEAGFLERTNDNRYRVIHSLE